MSSTPENGQHGVTGLSGPEPESTRRRTWDPKRALGFDLPESPIPPDRNPARPKVRRAPPRKAPVVQKQAANTDRPPTAPGRIKEFVASEVVPVSGLTLKVFTLFLFLRFSLLHEFLSIKLHANLYILLLVGAIAYLTALPRADVWRPVKDVKIMRAWFIMSGFMLAGIPFSFWPGGSYGVVIPFIKDNVLCIPLIAGLFGTWALARRIFLVIASAATIVVVLSCLYPSDVGGRMGVIWNGSVSNPNDIAGHLIFLIPFLFFAGFSNHVNAILRPVYLACVPLAMFLVLKTGSRGAFIGFIAFFVFLFLTGNSKIRIGFVLAAPLLIAGLLAFLPKSALDRMLTFDSGSPNHEEAVASYEARQNLLRISISDTLRHPLLGVGAGQFGSYEGQKAIDDGHPHNNWQETHNSFTEISAETGIPALLCMLYATFGSLRILWRARRLTSNDPTLKEIASASQFLFAGSAAFCVCIFFLNFGYKMYLPFLTGLAIALDRALKAAQSSSADTFQNPSVNT
ncbi:MAG: O-antigen ligase family protein, partial [Acidobacteriaceae bacterium]|nr:O-antigen ligase family protein [Acidobacteriaceae bacterium]